MLVVEIQRSPARRHSSIFRRNTGYVLPRTVATITHRPHIFCRRQMTTDTEQIVHHPKGGQKTLHVRRRLESFHPPLPHPCWPMRIFGPVVGTFAAHVMRAACPTRARYRIAREFAYDHHARSIVMTPKQFPEESLGSVLVSFRLHQNVEHLAFLIHRRPQVLQLTS